MKAHILKNITDLTKEPEPLIIEDLPIPKPKDNEVLLKVLTCGICHTELDEIEGRMPPPELPVVLGHQVVGKIEKLGKKVTDYKLGDRVGVAWIFSSCGKCEYCLSGMENLCPEFIATGRDANGGYAEYMTAHKNFIYKIPAGFNDFEAAPLLCAGAIGYRSLKLAGIKNGQSLGLTGFGASAHLVLKMARYMYPDTRIYVFARNVKEREFAKELGAVWSGGTEEEATEKLNAIIDTTPVWKPVVEALKNLKPAGRIIINAIRKEKHDIDYLTKLSYHEHLWMEKEIKSVANIVSTDVSEFLELASQIPIKPDYQVYGFNEANKALVELKEGKIRGAKVLKIS